jgi:hypothetical protein
MKYYNFHNEHHLGDNVFNLIFFNNIKNYLENNNIFINYYCQSKYFQQLQEFIQSNKIILCKIENKPPKSIQLWIETPIFNFKFNQILSYSKNPYFKNMRNNHVFYNNFYKIFFNKVLNTLKFPLQLDKFYYEDQDLLTRYNNLNDKYKNIDILILNSQPFSGQYDYNKNEWDNYICELNKRYNIVTTTKVNNEIKCTMDDNLTIKTIAAISTKVPIIIAINSGVIPGLLNIYTLTNVKQFYTFDNRCCYSYPNFVSKEKINDITFNTLNNFLRK